MTDEEIISRIEAGEDSRIEGKALLAVIVPKGVSKPYAVEKTGAGILSGESGEVNMTLYHGSKSGIVGPITPSSRSTCDFGRAFYVGEPERRPLTPTANAETMFGVYDGHHTLSPDEAIVRLKEGA